VLGHVLRDENVERAVVERQLLKVHAPHTLTSARWRGIEPQRRQT
jgi:hypothetical protein